VSHLELLVSPPLVLLTRAFLSITTVAARSRPAPTELISLTLNETGHGCQEAEMMRMQADLQAVPDFVKAWSFVREHRLIDLDPWSIATSGEETAARSSGLNSRYPSRRVFCFAERQDTDDVACVVLEPGPNEHIGDVLLIHDFASVGSEVDAAFPNFWVWFKAAIDDVIDTVRHM